MSTSPNEPLTRDVTVADGVRLRVIEAGQPDAPPFVLVHGYPQSAAEWLGVMASAAGQARMIAVDLPGIGGSPAAPGGGSKAAIADLLHELIATLDLQDTTLVGHDAAAWSRTPTCAGIPTSHASPSSKR